LIGSARTDPRREPRGIAIAEATAGAAGIDRRRIHRLPWFQIVLLALFVETFREMLKIRYCWQLALRLDNRKLVDFLGSEPHTPLDQALAETLQGLGCLDRESRQLGKHQSRAVAG
jgi:nucleoside-diphosphate-sugar epimerase